MVSTPLLEYSVLLMIRGCLDVHCRLHIRHATVRCIRTSLPFCAFATDIYAARDMSKTSQSLRQRKKQRQARTSGSDGRGPAANSLTEGSSAPAVNSAASPTPSTFRVPNLLLGFVAATPLYEPTQSAMLRNQDAKTALRILNALGQVQLLDRWRQDVQDFARSGRNRVHFLFARRNAGASPPNAGLGTER